ncbi:MAG TPA: FAD-binding oxidoreductase, partial [Terriglobales bacterium]|nr:FAD-binding oxidoreductase [Terriglobales bacterium]
MSTAEDKFFHVRITQRRDFASDLWMIRVQAGGEFKFAPGQYATLGVERPEKRSERPYSIVSSPYEGEIEFFFELVPQGELTPHLYKLQVGDEMLMRKVPKGRFTLDTKSGRTNHLLISTVTGVAPFVSYVRTLQKDWKERK